MGEIIKGREAIKILCEAFGIDEADLRSVKVEADYDGPCIITTSRLARRTTRLYPGFAEVPYGASRAVCVRRGDGGPLVTLYSDDRGEVVLSNPVMPSASGELKFFSACPADDLFFEIV